MRSIGADIGTDAEPDDLATFVSTQGQALLRFAFLLTGGHNAQAEDLVYAVLGRLADRGIDDLDDPAAYARRAIVNEHRGLARRARRQWTAFSRLAGGRNTAESDATEDRLAVLAAIDDLSDRERAVIVLRYYEDQPDEQIAAIVGVRRSTVRSIVHRALPKLRSRLGDTYRTGEH